MCQTQRHASLENTGAMISTNLSISKIQISKFYMTLLEAHKTIGEEKYMLLKNKSLKCKHFLTQHKVAKVVDYTNHLSPQHP